MKGSFLTALYLGAFQVFPCILRKQEYVSTAISFVFIDHFCCLAMVSFIDSGSCRLAPLLVSVFSSLILREIVASAYPSFCIQKACSTILPLVSSMFLRGTSICFCSAAKFFVSVTHIWLLDIMSFPLFNDCL